MDTSTINYKKMSSLFLQQSYIDSWEDYCRSIHQTNFAKWDYVILTASNEAEAEYGPDKHLKAIERQSFYERSKKAYLVILTGEERLYGDLLLVKGVVE